MEMTMNAIPLETTFEAPEGNYAGELTSVFLADQESTDGLKQIFRFIFTVEVPSMSDKIVLVGKNLPPNSTKLRIFLERWLGREFVQPIAGKTFDFNTLIGLKADIMILHIHNPGYEKPYRNLAGAYPPGTLPLAETFNPQSRVVSQSEKPRTVPRNISIMPFAAPYGGRDTAPFAEMMERVKRCQQEDLTRTTHNI